LVERPRRSPENYGATCQPAASIVPSTLIVAPPRDERSTRNVTVTPSGEELLAVIDGVLDAFDERILAFESFTRLERGVLAVIDAAIGSGCSISFDPSDDRHRPPRTTQAVSAISASPLRRCALTSSAGPSAVTTWNRRRRAGFTRGCHISTGSLLRGLRATLMGSRVSHTPSLAAG
jgi:hypothetical protein